MTFDTAAATPLVPAGPRERALDEGISALGDADLLAVLLGTGLAGKPAAVVAAELLDQTGGLEALARLGPAAIAACPGIGLAKALRIGAAIEIGKRVAQRAAQTRMPLRTSADVAAYLTPVLGALHHEEMWLLALDGRNNLRAARRVARGGLHGCAVAARDILRVAIAEAASTMVLAHNHPSGDPSPSPADVAMTKAVADAAAVVGVALVDHVIVTGQGLFSSMLDLGILDSASE